jgi:hypothetical protein
MGICTRMHSYNAALRPTFKDLLFSVLCVLFNIARQWQSAVELRSGSVVAVNNNVPVGFGYTRAHAHWE